MNGNRKVNERKDNTTWTNAWIDMCTKRKQIDQTEVVVIGIVLFIKYSMFSIMV